MHHHVALTKYLERYAEPTARWAEDLVRKAYESVVVIPAFDESPDFPRRLLQSCSLQSRLVVLVVNAPLKANAAEVLRTQNLLRSIKSGAKRVLEDSTGLMSLCQVSLLDGAAIDFLLINALEPQFRLEEKEGVGRARKMGCDAALALYRCGRVRSEYLGSTDADARLDDDYFEALHGQEGASCLSFPYRYEKTGDVSLDQAMAAVEAHFRTYVLGLARAGSPYAYHSLGSALAVSYQHYAQVRGIPNRQAGEDFHLLCKLVKLAPMRKVATRPVLLMTRLSQRVPFGTGPSLLRAAGGEEELLTYHPQVFADLELFLETMKASARRRRPVWRDQLSALPGWLHDECEGLYQRLENDWDACPTEAHRLRRLHERFDALRTLQLIHRRERSGLERRPLHDVFSAWGIVASPDAPEAAYLARLEQALPPLIGPSLSADGSTEQEH